LEIDSHFRNAGAGIISKKVLRLRCAWFFLFQLVMQANAGGFRFRDLLF
jgi:hypothetical protein